ncbi:Pyruvate dehydrogenase (acetyl-transferring) [Xylanimonas cellulosilytica DSM 15894]|uniref:2-oxoisovalerate dehydrogenase subunit alpha n=1 Tax=Xylanimonas cellulosilytica (strain DSM 15894 / JCM 12276 / CECT 5975 / KCTC 9989 / LMG 20990 / NBRC 107835 / XIL07) TaxID=446471 RepID=D1BUA2_XYLCX|nr:thiamine pyrophosphate-dependent enzyme [Xylanimonas cellulosilytica]ACZ31115.1 Pyruvate dehydrogenase (acetyl-transferring) [Xylanimonas cellulosilytica DSM 15894]
MPGITDSPTRDGLPPAGIAGDDLTREPDRRPGGVDDVGTVRLLDPDGGRHPWPEHDRWLTDVDGEAGGTTLLRLYEDMVVVRRIDAEATALQRQGELALWPPLLGQEAAQVGSAHALRRDDFVFSSYREHAVAYVRGVTPVDLVREWRGVTGSGWDPYAVNMATPQVIVGGHPLHGVGYAMGVLADAERARAGDDTAAAETAAVVTYFGDGAMSQGAVSEAFVFAATWSAPVVFFCQNNQWAISEPVALQSRVPLVNRAAGFGLAGVRVDGNDVLAVLAVTRAALHRARTGGGATLVEAVTYRRGPHTTADDPTRYRDTAEVEAWVRRDPVDRFAAHLRGLGVLTDDAEARVRAAADEVAADLRARIATVTDPPPMSIFEHVYAEPHEALAAERDAYARYLAGFADDAGPTDAGPIDARDER